MSTCSCGGVTIECPGGCGCLCLSGSADCVRWCEPSDPFFLAEDEARAANQGGLVRIVEQADGTQRMTINGQVGSPAADSPRYAPTTPLQGCLHGATLESLALVLSALHTCTVRAPADRAKDTIDESIGGTLEELAERFGLIVE